MMTQSAILRLVRTAGLAAALATSPALAQNPFSAAAWVNGDIVTHYEVEQRALFLDIVRTPGDLEEQALEALVNERLQSQLADEMGLTATPEEIEEGVVEFAARADLGVEQFLRQVGEEGVAPETVRDFVAAGISWRKVVQTRFGPVARADANEPAVETARLYSTSLDDAELLLAEIVVPITAQNQDTLREEIGRLADDLNGRTDDFSEAARRFSVVPTREEGGLTGWRPFSAIPPVLREYFLTLAPGETSEPISLGPAWAIYQMRGVRERGFRPPATSAIEYATIPVAGGLTPEGLAAAAELRAAVDSCEDLYGQSPAGLEITTAPLRDIPTDIAMALSPLDPGEMSFEVTRQSGSVLLVVMMCDREVETPEGGLEAIQQGLFTAGLESYADTLLAELHADAIIEYTP